MTEENSKGQWGSKFGFLMATIGAAVGLGNLWGFRTKWVREADSSSLSSI